MKRRLLAAILVVSLALVLVAACTPVDQEPAARPGTGADTQPPGAAPPPVGTGGVDMTEPAPEGAVFQEHLDLILDNNAIAVLNVFSPAGGTSSAGWAVRLIHDSLVYFIGDGEYAPMLANSWTTSDYKTFSFYLRDDVYFHNGEKFNADSVVFTANMSSEFPGTNGHDVWRTVESIRAIDEYTVEIVLNDVNVEFLFELSNPWGAIHSERAFNTDRETFGQIGTGPFKVTAFSTNDYVDLARFDDFWGDIPPTQSINMRFIPEPATRLMMMENFEADLCFALGPEDIAILDANPDFEIIPLAFNNPNILGFNLADPIVGDYNFRMAVAHAICSEEIAIAAAGEWAAQVFDMTNVWGLDQEFRNPNTRHITQDIELAKEYLANSSYNGETIELAAAIITNVRAAEAIQQMLRVIGINTEINQMDAPGLNAYAQFGANQTQMFVFVSATRFNAGSIANLYRPYGPQNRWEMNDPDIIALLDRAAATTDVREREALYMELQEIISQNPPALNIFWRLNGVAARTNMGGFNLRSDMMYNLRGIFRIAD